MNFSNLTMDLEFFGHVSIYFGIGIQIVFAVILGGIVGFDRELKMKAAGLRTNIMICLGATLYTTMSIVNLVDSSGVIDPNRIAAQIVSGIGFLGAGAIIQGRGNVTGLTTAATIWVVAAIGYTIGVGYPFVATLFTLTVYSLLKFTGPVYRLLEGKKGYQDYYLEVLSKGSVKKDLDEILNSEGLTCKNLLEEFHNEANNERILSLTLNLHPRVIERVSSELNDCIRVQKINFRTIDIEFHCVGSNPQNMT